MSQGKVLHVWLPLSLGLFLLIELFFYGSGPRDGWRVTGFLLGLTGLAGIILARYTLGRSFSIRPKATELVTRGIYSRIRNPIYISGVVFLGGLLLLVRKRYGWLLLVLLIPMQMIRAHREARVLEAKFGDAYRVYRARTWF